MIQNRETDFVFYSLESGPFDIPAMQEYMKAMADGAGEDGPHPIMDAEAVESAIQTVLAACKEFDVPCGITAGVDDIAERLEQGFRVIIVTQPEALAAGRRAAGRQN